MEAKYKPAAVLVGHVRQGDMEYRGIAQHDGLVPHLKAFPKTKDAKNCASWQEVFDSWRTVLDKLAHEIKTGHAALAPKKYPATCQHCALPTLCRVHEAFAEASAMSEDVGD
jgi:hypothetical protein